MNRKLRARVVLEFGKYEAFARVLGVDPSVISRVIHGHRKLSDTEKSRWAAALRCHVNEVF